MPDILEEMKKSQQRNDEEVRKLYLEILTRSSRGQSSPTDAAILGEIAKELGLPPKQIEADAANWKYYLAASSNAESFDGVKMNAAIAAAAAERDAAYVVLQKAQADFDATTVRYNNASGTQMNQQRAFYNLARARENVAHLLNPPAPAPKAITRSAEVTGSVRQVG